MTGKRNLTLIRILKLALILALTITAISAAQLTGHAAFSFTAVPVAPNTDTQVSLSWSSVADAACYKINRAKSDDSLQTIKTIDVDTEKDYLDYIDTGLEPETDYIYEICAYSDKNATN